LEKWTTQTQSGLKVSVFFEIQDDQLQFQIAFKDHFGRSDKVNFTECAGLSGRLRLTRRFELYRQLSA
jgi:hypothetical protein